MPTAAAAQHIDFDRARDEMVERQVRTWEVFDSAVLGAMKTVPREDFVPPRYRNLACADMQIPLAGSIEGGEIMMQPKVEGRLLQALAIKNTDTILEIGTGSGYLASLLATLGGSVLSFDIRPEFTRAAETRLAALGMNNVRLQARDAATLEGIDEQFDCIVVTGSMPTLHDSFRQRLKMGGRLFVVAGTDPIMEAQLHTRVTADDWAVESLFDTSLPPLVNAWNPRRFAF